MKKTSDKIVVFGGSGFVGRNLTRSMSKKGFKNIISMNSKLLDLRDGKLVEEFFSVEKPGVVFFLAANYGGVNACKKNKANFLYSNSLMSLNLIEAAHKFPGTRLINVSSSTIYPKSSSQPLKECFLLDGKLEENVEGYALSKVLAVKLADFYHEQYGDEFFSVVPTNMYGPEDRFYDTNSNVVAALITKFHEAKLENKDRVELFGTGKPKRDLLYVEDFVNALLFLIEVDFLQIDKEYTWINIGSGNDVSISELAETVKGVVGFKGDVNFDSRYPDGAMRKLLDISRIETLGWKPQTDIHHGVETTYEWFKRNADQLRKRGA